MEDLIKRSDVEKAIKDFNKRRLERIPSCLPLEIHTAHCTKLLEENSEMLQAIRDIEPAVSDSTAEGLIQSQKNGVLNKHIYSNGGFMPNEIELFEKLEKVLGYKLFRWQKTFLILGAFRQHGETTAIILRDLLAVKEPPLDLSKPKGAIERFNRDDYREMQDRLTAAGIPTRTVFYSEKQKKHYGRHITVSFIDETGR